MLCLVPLCRDFDLRPDSNDQPVPKSLTRLMKRAEILQKVGKKISAELRPSTGRGSNVQKKEGRGFEEIPGEGGHGDQCSHYGGSQEGQEDEGEEEKVVLA